MRLLAFVGLLTISCLLAFVRGSRAHLAVALAFVCAFDLSLALVFPITVHREGIDPRLMLIDVGLMLVLTLITLRFRSRSVAMLTGLQLVILCFHFVKLIDPAVLRSEYRIMTIFWAYIQLALLDLAIVGRIWRLPDWLRFLDPLPDSARVSSQRN